MGVRHSGTTLLVSLLGAHPEINATHECKDDTPFRQCGKKYQVNKLCISQIHEKRRANVFGFILNRIVNLGKRGTDKYLYPISKCSIADYRNHNTIFIVITREKDMNIDSIMRRNWKTKKEATKMYNKDIVRLHAIADTDLLITLEESALG